MSCSGCNGRCSEVDWKQSRKCCPDCDCAKRNLLDECTHPKIVRGKDIQLIQGLVQSEVCTICARYRRVDHLGGVRSSWIEPYHYVFDTADNCEEYTVTEPPADDS